MLRQLQKHVNGDDVITNNVTINTWQLWRRHVCKSDVLLNRSLQHDYYTLSDVQVCMGWAADGLGVEINYSKWAGLDPEAVRGGHRDSERVPPSPC